MLARMAAAYVSRISRGSLRPLVHDLMRRLGGEDGHRRQRPRARPARRTSGSHGLSSSSSATQNVNLPGCPRVERSSWPGHARRARSGRRAAGRGRWWRWRGCHWRARCAWRSCRCAARIGPLTTTNGALPPVLAVQPCRPNSGAAIARTSASDDRHVLGQAPRHHGGDRDLLRGDAAAAHRLDADHVRRRRAPPPRGSGAPAPPSAARWAARRSGPRAGTARWPRRRRPPPTTTTPAATQSWPRLHARSQRLPQARRRERHVELRDAERRQRVDGGVDDGGRNADAPGLAHALGARAGCAATACTSSRSAPAAPRRRAGSRSPSACRSGAGRRRRRRSPPSAPGPGPGRGCRGAGPRRGAG